MSKKKIYYNNLKYKIEQKITVKHSVNILNYLMEDIYLYVIHDNSDDNRFIYFTTNKSLPKNYEIDCYTFDFISIDNSKPIKFTKKLNNFGDSYIEINEDNYDIEFDFSSLINNNKDALFKRFKTDKTKICIDKPNWYLDEIKKVNCNSYMKKILKDLLVENQYNKEIVEHCISTMFQLRNNEYMMLNDHSIVLDQGKTGKSSLIGYFGEKLDNVSVAGLYGSSDSKSGTFVGGLVTTTKKSILIDEVNELIMDKKGERILSVLNSLLENGQYNYRKQFGQLITSSNQFLFLGNISEKFSLSIFLHGTFGNTETIGRRIGIITYNSKLNGFKRGKIRKIKKSVFLQSICILLSNIFNSIIESPKYLKKLTNHTKYKALESFYYGELTKIQKEIFDPTSAQFIKSHKESIDRACTRSLKLLIFNNMDKYIRTGFRFEGQIIYDVLQGTERILKQNIININNIKSHMNDCVIENTEIYFNKINYDKVSKGQKQFLEFIFKNLDKIDNIGVDVETLDHRSLIKYVIKNFKLRGINNNFKKFLFEYGCNVQKIHKTFVVRVINKNMFLNKTKGLFS